MKTNSYMRGPSHFYISSFILFHFLFVSSAITINPPYKAVNLGGWLVTEGWMKPSLFDGIPNKDLLDGTQIQLKSAKLQKYVAAENGGGESLVVNRNTASGWETLRLWRINESTFNFRVNNNQFVGVNNQRKVVAVANTPGNTETFQIMRNPSNPNQIRIKGSNGLFLQAPSETAITADYGGSSGWGDNDPSVFNMGIVNTLQGEYQITNGYGPDKAPQVMRDHWNTYITEQSFIFMSTNGLNAVRIPVGWWIASGPTPPKPFVGGSLQALDNAFTWAQNHNMVIVVDLHAVSGSQNGNEHSGTRDGSQEWGDSYIQQTVAVIDFLAKRYANHPSLAAIELMNEPYGSGVTKQSLITYYQAGYDSVRKYTSSAYVILSNRGADKDPKEFISYFGSNLKRYVIDVHFYSLYNDMFNTKSVQQNIDYIYNDRAAQLGEITQSNGPLTFVGEWVAECGKWGENGNPMQDYVNFANAQLQVYGRATFGWSYWSYTNKFNHWSLKWMIDNNYIRLT